MVCVHITRLLVLVYSGPLLGAGRDLATTLTVTDVALAAIA